MNDEHKKPEYDEAFGQTIASIPELRALKEGAANRLHDGESDESVVSWLVDSTQSETNDLERALHIDRRFAGWILDWARSDEPGPFFEEARGAVLSWNMPDGEGGTVPLVFVVAGPTSDPNELAEEFLQRCLELFPPESWVKKERPERDARWFRLSKGGKQDWEIAAQSPEEDSWWGGANTVRQARFRWQRYVTRITRSR
jgi:hypothetical protein